MLRKRHHYKDSIIVNILVLYVMMFSVIPPRPIHVFVFVSLLSLANGCSWTPRVETPMYEGPQASLTLTTVSEPTFAASHPVKLKSDTVQRLLRGLQIRQNNRLLQKIFSGEPAPQPVFTEAQIELFTPQLVKAFSQATPEEQIRLQSSSDGSKDICEIRGTMFVQDQDLHIAMRFVTHHSHTSIKSRGKGIRPDQDGRGTPVMVFSPKEAIRGEAQPHWFLGGEEKNTFIINMPLLASLPRQGPAHSLPSERRTILSHPVSPPPVKNAGPNTSDEPTVQKIISPQGKSAQPQVKPNAELLLEEIKALRKELAEQKEAIEQLKRQKN